MVFRVALTYPNGRTHEAVLDRAEALNPGTVFEMYGRRWRVDGLISGRHSDKRGYIDPTDDSTQYACVYVP
jgi:hypothetical protein